MVSNPSRHRFNQARLCEFVNTACFRSLGAALHFLRVLSRVSRGQETPPCECELRLWTRPALITIPRTAIKRKIRKPLDKSRMWIHCGGDRKLKVQAVMESWSQTDLQRSPAADRDVPSFQTCLYGLRLPATCPLRSTFSGVSVCYYTLIHIREPGMEPYTHPSCSTFRVKCFSALYF